MRRDPDDAAHEAAHAVVGVYYGLPLERVVLKDHDPETIFGTIPKRLRLHDAICDAAGPAADAMTGRYGRRYGKRIHYHWRGDFEAIRAAGFSAAERRVLLGIATDLLQGPLAKPWRAVTAALLERDLTGAEVRAYMLEGEPLEP